MVTLSSPPRMCCNCGEYRKWRFVEEGIDLALCAAPGALFACPAELVLWCVGDRKLVSKFSCRGCIAAELFQTLHGRGGGGDLSGCRHPRAC